MRPLSNQQRRNLVDTSQLYENHLDALRHAQSHAYGMRWKIIRGVSYLFRERDRRGNGKLLGRRSPETEAILSQFLQGKQDKMQMSACSGFGTRSRNRRRSTKL